MVQIGFYVAVTEIYCVYLHVCGGGGGLFPVGPCLHTSNRASDDVIGVQSTMNGGEDSE